MQPLLLFTTLLLSAAAAWLTIRALVVHPTPGEPQSADDRGETSFLFQGSRLVDASGAADGLLETAEKQETDLLTLIRALKPRFPDLDRMLDLSTDLGHPTGDPSGDDPEHPVDAATEAPEIRKIFHARTPEDAGRIEFLQWGGFTRLTLSQPEVRKDADWECAFLREEVAGLRQLLNTAPFPIWRQTSAGAVTWANTAYLDTAANQADVAPEEARGWPPVKIFTDLSLDQGTPESRACRLPLQLIGQKEETWFDCRSFAVGRESLHYAVDASAAVSAQRTLEQFVQTLTKTFAHLPIGLAVFDRSRRLALFNPALTDLTGLPVDFLSLRPTLDAVFDRLRESRLLPEPRNFAEWRRRITQAEAESTRGAYEETWTLPSGRSFRLTGRPHPDNAIAFLLEDISTEVSLTRHFRAELEISQAVLDTMEDAIAVFSEGGRLAFTNRAFARLWFGSDDCALSEFTIFETSRMWRNRCHPTPAWGDLREFAAAPRDRAEWEADVRMLDGRALRTTVAPLPGNATLVRFRAADTAVPFTSVRLQAHQG
ncbi:PAS-domain containing protein [Pseudoruegeria sp. SHC-113]|uniref:PAS-domain containing protein n=1 Tax=Pseudoruegeria sp. SHC-113 TaxID=2855439 RepID=UPI0021BAAA6B|nr:PAS-domain containing protein [Pseudoruegeria sp. SHC-113]MCT8158601.1 PAS-domain containing protein [Pseudoruegeria sp. SHC-113]